MPPITSSRAGTRVTTISPALKNPASPVGSLLGRCSSRSNSSISYGSGNEFMSARKSQPRERARSRQSPAVAVVTTQPLQAAESTAAFPDTETVACSIVDGIAISALAPSSLLVVLGIRPAMTFPVYLQFFGQRLHPHLVLETLGYFAGARIYFNLRRRSAATALPLETNLWLLVGCLFGAWAGSKLLAWAESPQRYWPLRHDCRELLG